MPKEINDQVIGKLIMTVREQSLCPRPTVLHRQVALIWNEAARDPALGLRPVTVPSYRTPKLIDWTRLSKAFRQDVDAHLSWCRLADPFAADARARPLAPRSLRLRRDQIHAAVTALVESGIKPSAIRPIADLVSPAHFKRILRRLWFPKIRSGRIRTVRQNQRIIAFDACDPPLACRIYRQSVQVAAPT